MHEMFAFEGDAPLHLFDYGLPDDRREQHWHSFYEFGFCVEGNGIFYVGDETIPLGPGDLLYLPPYEPHIGRSGAAGNCRCTFVYFAEALFQEEDRQLLRALSRTIVLRQASVAESAELPEYAAGAEQPERLEQTRVSEQPEHMEQTRVSEQLSFSELPALQEFLGSMREEFAAQKSGYAAMLRARLLELCVRLYRAEEERHSPAEWRGRMQALAQIKPAIDWVEANFSEPLELEDLARLLALSPSRARHLFKLTVGRRFKEYLTFVRIREAKRLLATTELSVTDIYLACGFQSSAPFYRSFAQLVGLNPLEYRRVRGIPFPAEDSRF